jgi:hypothetical protein
MIAEIPGEGVLNYKSIFQLILTRKHLLNIIKTSLNHLTTPNPKSPKKQKINQIKISK